MISSDHVYTFSIGVPWHLSMYAKRIILNLLILMLMVFNAHANKYSVINHCSLVSDFLLCNYCSFHCLSLSSFPHSSFSHGNAMGNIT